MSASVRTLACCDLTPEGESSGVVYFFCTAEHRAAFQAAHGEPTSAFDDGEALAGTVCDHCGTALDLN